MGTELNELETKTQWLPNINTCMYEYNFALTFTLYT